MNSWKQEENISGAQFEARILCKEMFLNYSEVWGIGVKILYSNGSPFFSGLILKICWNVQTLAKNKSV